jgi:hypothetical protein
MSRPVFWELPKQPGEQIVVPGFDFANQMVGEELDDEAEVKIFERLSGEEVTDDMLVTDSVTVTGSVVSFELKAGDHNLDYYCEIVATTAAPKSRPLHGVVIIGVRDRPY